VTRFCETCGHYYDDEFCWTLCPHGPLWAPLHAYCREYDLVNCKLHGEPHEYAQLARASGAAPSDTQIFQTEKPTFWRRGMQFTYMFPPTPIVATTWCGSRVDIRGRFWPWLFGWIRGGWRPSAFRMRRIAANEKNEIEI
jgi:hypothetical protein